MLSGIGTKNIILFSFKTQFMWRHNKTLHIVSDRINYFEKCLPHKIGAGYSITNKSSWGNHDN